MPQHAHCEWKHTLDDNREFSKQPTKYTPLNHALSHNYPNYLRKIHTEKNQHTKTFMYIKAVKINHMNLLLMHCTCMEEGIVSRKLAFDCGQGNAQEQDKAMLKNRT